MFALFDKSTFIQEKMVLYGEVKNVSYCCIDLLWGRGLYRELRFVLTEIDGARSVLVSTDLTIAPTQIVRLYCKRFKVECTFRELKQVVAGFSYHFWSKAMPKLQMFKSNDVNKKNLENVTSQHDWRLISATKNAIEAFVQLSAIALGMLQLVGLKFGDEIIRGGRYMRTLTNNVPSERTVASYLRKNIYLLFHFFPNLTITSIIHSKMRPPPGCLVESPVDSAA